ncbi:MAG: leucyl aminopeptidase family protein [Sumerlaeia bacterium]
MLSSLSVLAEVKARGGKPLSADAIVALHGSGAWPTGVGEPIEGLLREFAEKIETGTCQSSVVAVLPRDAAEAAPMLLLDSVTLGNWLPGVEGRKAAMARVIDLARRQGVERLQVMLSSGNGDAADLAADLFEGAALGDFTDERFKSKTETRPVIKLVFVVDKERKRFVEAALKRRQGICEGISLARLLVNAPHNILTPEELADEALRLAEYHQLGATVLDEEAIQRQDYRLLWNVGRGSEYPPRMVVLRYAPKNARKGLPHVVLVGKGMTYDSGGYSIKTRESMPHMNGDMGGAATVLGAMQAIASMELPVRVTAIIPSAHNAIDAAAYQPGCILTHKSGKTVFIGNTDAEGRLILADAFHRAGEEKAQVMIDFATLTGAAVRALGPSMAALFTDDEALSASLLKAAGDSGDTLWRLPLWKEYESSLRHPLADMNNISQLGADGGAIHAANFLKAFVPEGVRWAHVDLAGPALAPKGFRFLRPGASGFGVRLVAQWLQDALAAKAI